MELEVALSSLQSLLEKRGVKLRAKTMSALVVAGRAKEQFKDLNAALFEVKEWRAFGDDLWDAVLVEQKHAKKLQAPWQEVPNCLKRYRMQRATAQQAVQVLNARDDGKASGSSAATFGAGPRPTPTVPEVSARHPAAASGTPDPATAPTTLPVSPEPPPEFRPKVPHPNEDAYSPRHQADRDSHSLLPVMTGLNYGLSLLRPLHHSCGLALLLDMP
ncbi:uncharacterized protein [Excalfactoria chinensis]|uniref:uncharacterized protein n=1 Tax=Excalfactoria chinensis TaxID=46218 RepID=UPI003B3A93B6